MPEVKNLGFPEFEEQSGRMNGANPGLQLKEASGCKQELCEKN